MSEHRELIERLFNEVINRGNLDVADELFAPAFVDHGPMGEMRGVEAFKQVVEMGMFQFLTQIGALEPAAPAQA